MDSQWFKEGLQFSCTRCSACCRHDPGFVFLSDQEAFNLAKALGLSFHAFTARSCVRVHNAGQSRLSLREKANYDCILWHNGCIAYDQRPRQCKTFPFWSSVLVSRKAWETAALDCPGINQGTWHSAEEIQAILDQEGSEADY